MPTCLPAALLPCGVLMDVACRKWSWGSRLCVLLFIACDVTSSTVLSQVMGCLLSGAFPLSLCWWEVQSSGLRGEGGQSTFA